MEDPLRTPCIRLGGLQVPSGCARRSERKELMRTPREVAQRISLTLSSPVLPLALPAPSA